VPNNKIVSLVHVLRMVTCGAGLGANSDTATAPGPLPLYAVQAYKKVEVVKHRGKKEKKPAFEQLPMGPAVTHNADPSKGTYVASLRMLPDDGCTPGSQR
jgi:hypothetical protein